MTEGWERDPGWPIDWLTLVPGVFLIRSRRAGVDGLVALRQLFAAFSVGVAATSVVVVVLAQGPGPTQPQWTFGVLLLVIGAASVTACTRAGPSLDCGDDASLVESFRARFLIGLAFAESAALLGFVAFFLTGQEWMYFAGAAMTAVGFWRLAPTAAHLDQAQAVLRAAGCTRSLVAALRRTGT